jgi:hypothetical protein
MTDHYRTAGLTDEEIAALERLVAASSDPELAWVAVNRADLLAIIRRLDGFVDDVADVRAADEAMDAQEFGEPTVPADQLRRELDTNGPGSARDDA